MHIENRLQRVPRASSLFWVMLAALSSGLLLRLAYPPSGMPTLLVVSLLPLYLTANYLTQWENFFVGLLAGLISHVDMTAAFISWGWKLTMLPFFGIGLLFGFYVFTFSVLARRLPKSLNWLLLPALWITISALGEHIIGIPLLLSAVFVFSEYEVLGLSKYLTARGLDFVLIAMTGLIGSVLLRHLTLGASLGGLLLLLVFLLAAPDIVASKVDSVRTQSISLIQPAIPLSHQRQAKWSLSARSSIERQLDTLTERAVKEGAEIIVWPEGGNGLANRRLLRRIEKFMALADEFSVTLLASGIDVTPSGDRFSVVHLVEGGQFHDARKANPVRFSEDMLGRGSPTVFESAHGNIGIAICYDSLFYTHISDLKRLGADFVVVASNDSSFGLTATQYWHVALSLARGVEVGLPIIFHSNSGLSVVSNVLGRIQFSAERQIRPSVLHWTVDLPPEKKIKSDPLARIVPLSVGLIIVATMLTNRLMRYSR